MWQAMTDAAWASGRVGAVAFGFAAMLALSSAGCADLLGFKDLGIPIDATDAAADASTQDAASSDVAQDGAQDALQLDAQALDGAPGDAPGDACSATVGSWTCPASNVVPVNAPGEFCRRWPWMGSFTGVAVTTPSGCLSCGSYTCACVETRADPATALCGVDAGYTCTEDAGGPVVQCN